MSRKKRYISLEEPDYKSVLQAFKTGKSASLRQRAQAILLSAEGKSISELCSIFHVLPNAITNWFNRWEKGKVEGLKTVAGQGRPLTVKVEDAPLIATIKAKVEANPKKLDTILAELEQESHVLMSRRTLKRFLKKVVTDGSDLGGI
jgi:transposase